MASFTVKSFCTRKRANLSLLKFSVIRTFSSTQKCYTSALHVPGNKAHKSFAYLSPEIDVDTRFTDIQKLQKEISLRGLTLNVEELKKSWDYFKYVNSNKQTLEEKLAELSSNIKTINQNENLSDDDKKQIEILITQSRLIKQDLKVMKEAAWDLEETVIPEVLKLPNEIDERTPSENCIVIKSVGEKPNIPQNKTQNHLDIGKNLGLLEYKNPIQCYLCNELVFFELGALTLAGEIVNESGATRIAGPDFCRSLLVEGCGMDHESAAETFILQNSDDVEKEYLINKLHLVGGASLPALLAMFTKQTVKRSTLPIKIFSSGRHYTPFPTETNAYGLFSVCQASVVHALTLVENKDSDDYKNEFQNMVETASKIYDAIECHYRIVMRSAKELNPAESMKISFEMWSAHSNQYIEVGHVSACGTYLSKRLLMAYQTTKHHGFPATVSGTLLSVPRVLGCLLEENPDKFVLPKNVARYI